MLDLMIRQIRSKATAIIYHQLLLAVIFNHPQPYKGPVEVPTVDPSGAMWHVVVYSLSLSFFGVPCLLIIFHNLLAVPVSRHPCKKEKKRPPHHRLLHCIT